jgi:hypothetical protein
MRGMPLHRSTTAPDTNTPTRNLASGGREPFCIMAAWNSSGANKPSTSAGGKQNKLNCDLLCGTKASHGQRQATAKTGLVELQTR